MIWPGKPNLLSEYTSKLPLSTTWQLVHLTIQFIFKLSHGYELGRYLAIKLIYKIKTCSYNYLSNDISIKPNMKLVLSHNLSLYSTLVFKKLNPYLQCLDARICESFWPILSFGKQCMALKYPC